MLRFIDSHAHIDFPDFSGDEQEIISRAEKAGVFKILNVGVDIERSRKSIELAKRYIGTVFATVGLHPKDAVGLLTTDWLQELRDLAKNPEVVAIGECGLDFFRLESGEEKERQKELFQSQIDLAEELNLPIIIHTRDAEKETLEILLQNKEKISGGVVHCFTGTKEFAKELLDLGLYIGFTGIITFQKTAELLAVVKEVPLDRIFIETDAPFLAPAQNRGKRNEPAYVIEVAKKIAEIKGISMEKVAEVTIKNTEELFRL